MILYAISVGLSVTMGLMGFVNLAHGVFAMAGGYLMITLMGRFGMPWLAALLAGDDFLAYLESHPASFRVVLETLARTIRRLSDRVEDLIFLDVPSRVAKYLLDLVRSSGGDGNELTLTQDELAAFIGASRVSVNRVLGDLERREIISIRRRRIAIKDADRLAKEVRF